MKASPMTGPWGGVGFTVRESIYKSTKDVILVEIERQQNFFSEKEY